MLPSESTSLLNRARQSVNVWAGNTLFNSRSSGRYFEYVLEAIDPMWSLEFNKARIVGLRTETNETKTLILKPSSRWSGFLAGQHISLSIEINGAWQTRVFTIASSPNHFIETGLIELTLKSIEGGRVTPWLHSANSLNQIARISDAFGEFLLPTSNEGHSLYLAAGSGITPVMSHLRDLVSQQFPYPVTLVYYASTPADWIFVRELKAMDKALKRFHLHLVATQGSAKNGRIHGRINDTQLQNLLVKPPTHIFVCGPSGFETKTKETLEAFELQLVPTRSEHFTARPRMVEPNNGTGSDNSNKAQIQFVQSGVSIESPPQTTLLEAAEQNGLRPTAGCRMGICHTCICTKTAGVVRNLRTGEISGPGEEEIQLCVSVPESDITLKI